MHIHATRTRRPDTEDRYSCLSLVAFASAENKTRKRTQMELEVEWKKKKESVRSAHLRMSTDSA